MVSRLPLYRTSMFPILLLVLSSLSLAIATDPVARYDNCDIDTYYGNHKDGKWTWKRNEIASLLLQTHRQVVPSDAVSEFLSGGFSLNTTTLSRQYATYTTTRRALTDLDHGMAIARQNNNNVTIKTVHMIFTKTDIPVSDDFSIGWEPGYIWPMDDLKDFLPSLNGVENELDYKDEAIAAIHDLHNIRPRHPIVHQGHRVNDWFYNSCQECKVDQSKFTEEQNQNAVQQRSDIGRVDEDEDEGTDHLCVCTQEHALQPPKMARGEVARALLYMNLRYGNQLDGSQSPPNSPYLDLRLTDCHPLKSSADYDDDFATDQSSNAIGYFSRLVEWHLADPPNQREIDRNNAICRYYQGNRNPFVDFYEESWALLDFETIEREVCPGAARHSDDDSVVLDVDVDLDEDQDVDVDAYKDANQKDIDDRDENYDDDFDLAEFVTENEIQGEKETKGYGCEELMPGDISFFMVKPSLQLQGATNTEKPEGWSSQSFGLVSLVDLKPGMDIYVVGVDDEDPETETVNHEGGTLKLEVPKHGIPAGSFFGYGNRMYLGTEWKPIVETADESDFTFSVHQLYLYCVETMDNEIAVKSGVKEEYKILAALSTTGKSFGNEGLPTYWDDFLDSHSGVQLSEHFTDGVHYGLIVLPKDASDSEVSGGYRYEGPTYTKHDPYAKALIDEGYWEQINNIENKVDLGIYYKSGEEEQQSAFNSTDSEVDTQPQKLDGGSGGRANSVSSLVVYSMAFVTCILTYAIHL